MPLVITWRWRPGAKVAVFGERWKREPDGTIVAEYTVDELQLCLAVAGHDFTQEQLLEQGGKAWKMKHEWPLERALALAQKLEAALKPACARTLIVGSVRREKAWVKDVELVVEAEGSRQKAVGGKQLGLLDEAGAGESLEAVLARLVESGALRAGDKNGEKYKNFFVNAAPILASPAQAGEGNGAAEWGELKLDLFIVRPPAQWGAIVAIRTGPADFSKWLVTQYPYGAMPHGMKMEGGALWKFGKLVETPTEEDFFRALGLAWEVPSQRRAGYNRLLVEA